MWGDLAVHSLAVVEKKKLGLVPKAGKLTSVHIQQVALIASTSLSNCRYLCPDPSCTKNTAMACHVLRSTSYIKLALLLYLEILSSNIEILSFFGFRIHLGENESRWYPKKVPPKCRISACHRDILRVFC